MWQVSSNFGSDVNENINGLPNIQDPYWKLDLGLFDEKGRDISQIWKEVMYGEKGITPDDCSTLKIEEENNTEEGHIVKVKEEKVPSPAIEKWIASTQEKYVKSPLDFCGSSGGDLSIESQKPSDVTLTNQQLPSSSTKKRKRDNINQSHNAKRKKRGHTSSASPNGPHETWTDQEDNKLAQIAVKLFNENYTQKIKENQWKYVAKEMNGRTQSACKKRFTHLKKTNSKLKEALRIINLFTPAERKALKKEGKILITEETAKLELEPIGVMIMSKQYQKRSDNFTLRM